MQNKTQTEQELQSSTPVEQVGKRPFFTVDKIAKLALLTALATVLYLFDFPLLPSAGHLKMDLSDVISFFVAFMYGPIEGLIVIFLKTGLKILIKGSQFPIGEVAVLLVGLVYIIPASFIYKAKKTQGGAIIALVVADIAMIIGMYFANKYIMLPQFLKPELLADKAFMAATLATTCIFNFLKSLIISLTVFFLYKPFHKLINKVQIPM